MCESKKVIYKEVSTCDDCPYCEYNPYYSFGTDSGYDCTFGGGRRRIIDDWDWDNLNNPDRLILKYDGIPIPEWCPLPNKEVNNA